jgi:hypothetical protein
MEQKDQILATAARKMPCKGCAGREVVGNGYCVVGRLEVAGEVRRITGRRGCSEEVLKELLNADLYERVNGKAVL